MIIISWLRRSLGIRTNLERLMFGNYSGKSFNYLRILKSGLCFS